MVLPSQSVRPDNRRTNMYRRRRVKPMLALGLIAILIGGSVWMFYPDREGDIGSPDDANGAPDGTNAANDDGNENAGANPPRPSGGSNDSTPPNRDNISSRDNAATRDQSESRDTNNTDGGGNTASDRSDDSEGAPDQDTGASRDDLPTQEEMQHANQMSRYAFTLDTQGNLVEARRYYTQALATNALAREMTEKVHIAMKTLSDKLLFSKTVVPDDPFVRTYALKRGEGLEAVVKSLGLPVDWRFIQRINGIVDPNRVREGQTIKIVTAPFHAVIDKSDYRLDLYMGEEGDRVFVRSFNVGLGEYNSTPVGMFRITSRLINPEWRNPRTGELFLPDDPANPIGERWMGLQGTDDNTRDFLGYGIHGTIDPDSIGDQQSMGCVRLRPEDVEIVYEVLLPDVSTVEIRN